MIDIALIAGGVVSIVFEPFSIALHSIVGLAFVGTVGPHLWHRRGWIGGPDLAAASDRRMPVLGDRDQQG